MAWLDLVRSPFALDDLAGPPFVAEVTTRDQPTTDDVAIVRALAAVTVAVVDDAAAPPPAASVFDIVVDADGVDAVTAPARRHPHAAVTLVQLLRAGESLDVTGALVAESLAYSTLLAGPEFASWLAGYRSTAPRPGAESSSGARPRVRVERDEHAPGVQRVVLDRAEVHNAFDAAMRDALVEALRGALSDPDGLVVLTGAGPSFSSGGDLGEFGSTPDPATAHVVRTTRSPAWWLATHADRVEARVHGACIGAGAELSACCGRVLAAADAWFMLPEVAMGLVPGAGGTMSIRGRVGRQRTTWLALTGAPIDAATACRWGLVDAVV